MDGPNVAVIASAYSGHEMLESFWKGMATWRSWLGGTAIEGETVLVIGAPAHRGYLSLFPWVILGRVCWKLYPESCVFQ